MIKVLHINTFRSGGAALCSQRIAKAISDNGVSCRMLSANGERHASVNTIESTACQIAHKDHKWLYHFPIGIRIYLYVKRFFHFINKRWRLNNLLLKNNTQHLPLHLPYSDYQNIAQHFLIEWADIIHLHWVADFVDYPTFFKNVNKPIVWTLHDKFPVVGLQHYCSEFYPVPDELENMDLLCRRIKREGILNAAKLNFVAISEMMVNICKHSDVVGGFPITLIHNGVDTKLYRPFNKKESRKELGLHSDYTIFLFSAYNINDPNKGLDRTLTALERVNIPNMLIVCIGNIPFGYSLPDTPFPVIATGEIKNQTKIAKYYSAADYFLHCSYEETFAQTPLEAVACGTPVISTPCSGASDLIRSFNGIVCNGFTVDDLVDGVRMAMNKEYDREFIRRDVIERFSYDKIAKQYIMLYQHILQN